MPDVIVLRPGTAVWDELVSLPRSPGGWDRIALPVSVARALGVAEGTVALSATVSTYLGETEKNLSAVFDRADRGGAVLLLDEADALFGKRSEVRDAHDRYADVEVAFPLSTQELATMRPARVRRQRPGWRWWRRSDD